MTSKGAVVILMLGLFAVCYADVTIDIETVMDEGCTSETTLTIREMRWGQLLYVNSTIWLEVHSFQRAETSSLQCPGPCDAQMETLYKIGLQPHHNDSDEVIVDFAAHEERGEEVRPKEEKPILCICKMETLIVFKGASTLVMCKEKSEVKNIRHSWKSQLESGLDETYNIVWLCFVLILSFLTILFICLAIYCCGSKKNPLEEQPEAGDDLSKVFRKRPVSGVSLISLLVDMKNEADTTSAEV